MASYEIDFLCVEGDRSGDAIAMRYEVNGVFRIHVVDGGYTADGPKLARHIRKYYGDPNVIDAVVVSHGDQDHAEGLQTILEEFQVNALCMLRPWLHAAELLPRFPRMQSVESLTQRLREAYPYISALEEIATKKGIQIYQTFQGFKIHDFTVLAPSRARYFDLLVQSNKTPETTAGILEQLAGGVTGFAQAVAQFVKGAWGDEIFSPFNEGPENEMSIVQFADIGGSKILLTGDAGRSALAESGAFAPTIGAALPGLKLFQAPHHGGRRAVSSELLDLWLGPRLPAELPDGGELFDAIISSAKADPNHPRKSVMRALIHRGGRVTLTEEAPGEGVVCFRFNMPGRPGWSAMPRAPYPNEQEENE